MSLAIPEGMREELGKLIDVSDHDMVLSRAPGRVEVLGNHTDYNSGRVLAATIDKYVWSLGAATDTVTLSAMDMNETFSFDPRTLRPAPEDSWLRYARGVFWAFNRRGHATSGVSAVIHGNVPLGGGLSSSAALEVSLVNLVKELSSLRLNPKAAAMLAFEAERLFCGISCGVMDQFASQLGKSGALIGINCLNLQTEDVALDMNAKFIIIDSMVSREASSALNQRRVECMEALKELQHNAWDIQSLSSIGVADLGQVEEILDYTHSRRVRHVVNENARVLEGISVLRSGDLKRFGEIMYESHCSSRDLYEVSHPKLDLLVEISREQEGIFGCRMSGAGFGGSVLALVDAKHLQSFISNMKKEYEAETGVCPQVVEVSIPGGVQLQHYRHS
jgi:galactokinase